MLYENQQAAGDSSGDMQPRSGACGAAGDQSRLVKRDERKQAEPVAGVETATAAAAGDYEDEIYRLEARGKRGVVISQPVAYPEADARVAHIDWFAFTLRPPQFKTHLWVIAELARLFDLPNVIPRSQGLYGYKFSAIIEEGGLLAWGGKNQQGTVYVSLNAQGCARIKDWVAIRAWCECYGARITRVDLAHDDFNGKTANMQTVRAWYEAGRFNCGGRKPIVSHAGDWWGDGVKGRTVYIGARANGKLLRVYEKGKQLGDTQSSWVRVELELHNKDRHIPLEALTRPAAYLAGAYKCLRYLSQGQSKVLTIAKAAKSSYAKAIKAARSQFGKLVNVMLRVHAGDPFAVVHQLKREGIPARLDPYSFELRSNPLLLAALRGEPDDAALVA